MSLRKPLVIVDGRIRQINAFDTLDAQVIEVDIINQVNGNAGAVVIGQAVYTSAAGTFDLAQANALATVEVLGIIKEGIASAASGPIQTDGVIKATIAQWDNVTGQVGGLTAGSVYYLDPDIAGNLTIVAPTIVEDFVARIGRAISTTELEISVLQPIEL